MLKKKTKKYIAMENITQQMEPSFDLDSIMKGLFIFAMVLLLIYCSIFFIGAILYKNSIWDDAYLGNISATSGFLPIILILLTISGLLFFLTRQFNKLAKFADEVESGEFERKEKENKIS